jgi:hypothetical protein
MPADALRLSGRCVSVGFSLLAEELQHRQHLLGSRGLALGAPVGDGRLLNSKHPCKLPLDERGAYHTTAQYRVEPCRFWATPGATVNWVVSCRLVR